MEVKLTFTAYIQAEGDSVSEAIENAMEYARANYGNEVYEYGEFIVEGQE